MSEILITGGTGSIGRALVQRLLEDGEDVLVFSRDEAKQYRMRREFPSEHLHFQLGDVRDYPSLVEATQGVELVIHCAALKHVPGCEQAPYEAVQTNVVGTHNLIRAATESQVPTVVGISTDKACQPIGVMGCTKALMERLLITANHGCTKFVCVRLGNVVPSRGSVFELFLRLLKEGKPLTVTSKHMTRFLLPIGKVAGMVQSVASFCRVGEIWVPILRSAYIGDIAEVLRGNRDSTIRYIGVRPGEKLHEHLVTEEESSRTHCRGDFFVICPPGTLIESSLGQEYCSRYYPMPKPELREFLDEALGDAWSPR